MWVTRRKPSINWRPIASSHLEKIAGCPMDDEQQPVGDELLQVPGDMVGACLPAGATVIFSTAGGGSTIFPIQWLGGS